MLEDKQRLFLVVCHRSLPTCACQFRLNSLVDSRLDLVANCVTSAILKSRATRRDTSVCFLFNDNTSQGFWLLIVDGDKVRHIRPDERNIASIIQKRVYNGCSCTAQEHIRIDDVSRSKATRESSSAVLKCCKGLCLLRCSSFENLLSQLDLSSLVACYLNENGQLVNSSWFQQQIKKNSYPSRKRFLVVLGDDKGLDQVQKLQDIENQLLSHFHLLSLGRHSLLTSQCITIIHYLLDSAYECAVI